MHVLFSINKNKTPDLHNQGTLQISIWMSEQVVRTSPENAFFHDQRRLCANDRVPLPLQFMCLCSLHDRHFQQVSISPPAHTYRLQKVAHTLHSGPKFSFQHLQVRLGKTPIWNPKELPSTRIYGIELDRPMVCLNAIQLLMFLLKLCVQTDSLIIHLTALSHT